MKTRICIVFMLFITLCGTTMSQNDKDSYIPRGDIYHAEDTSVVNGTKGVGWVRSHLLDDWFLQMQGGGQLYYGTDDREGLFLDRLTGNAELHFGRRIFPMFGFRLGLGYGYAHGFLTREHYNQYRNSIISHGYSGHCGNDATGHPYGGYYWDYRNDNNLLIQRWKYYYFGGDLFMDLALFQGAKHYDPYRHWNNIVYAGVHTKIAQSETDTSNHRTEGHIGYIGKYNFNPNWSIYADARLSFIERLFDREWLPGLESAGVGLDVVCNLQIGVIYKFYARTKKQRDSFRNMDDVVIDNKVTSHFVYIRMQDSNFVFIKDTTITELRHDTVPTPGMIDSLNWLPRDIARWSSLIDNSNGDDLDSNILGLLLPYEQIFFERDKWDILPSEVAKIEKMAKIMYTYPDTKYILIGSADSKTGTVKRNIFLGHVRADVVYNSLVNEYGIDSTRLSREYHGGILEYMPYELNRSTVILMDHPYVRRVFEEMKSKGVAGGQEVEINN